MARNFIDCQILDFSASCDMALTHDSPQIGNSRLSSLTGCQERIRYYFMRVYLHAFCRFGGRNIIGLEIIVSQSLVDLILIQWLLPFTVHMCSTFLAQLSSNNKLYIQEVTSVGGFLKWGYPQFIHLNGFFHYKPSFSVWPQLWRIDPLPVFQGAGGWWSRQRMPQLAEETLGISNAQSDANKNTWKKKQTHIENTIT